MPTSYTPSDPATQELFRRYKEALTTERELREKVKKAAEAELLRDGVSVGHLAEATGMSREVFRRIARTIGVERKREPTVGPLRRRDDEG